MLILALAAGALYTARAVPRYQSSVKFFVSTPTTGTDTTAAYSGSLFSQARVKSYADLVSGPRVAEKVVEDLGLQGTGAALGGEIQAFAQPDSVLIVATVTDRDPQRARRIADSVGRAFPSLVSALEEPPGGGTSPIKVTVVADATLGVKVYPNPKRIWSFALLLGVLLGLAAAAIREALDSTVKSPADVRESLSVGTLATIGYDKRFAKHPLIVHDLPHSPRTESFRQLRTNLQFADVDRDIRSLTVTSSVPAEGKSTAACNLALSLAEGGLRTVLIEGDLRRPRLSEYFGMEGAVGLTNVLIGRADLQDVLQPFGAGTLHVLPSGPLPPNPSEMLASRGMRSLIRQLESDFDIVIVDAPPVLPVTDAALLSSITGGTIVSVHAGKTRREQLRRSAESLSAVDAHVLGAILNMVPRRGPDSTVEQRYGYRGYTDKGYAASKDKPQMSEDEVALALSTSRHRGPVEPADLAVDAGADDPLEPFEELHPEAQPPSGYAAEDQSEQDAPDSFVAEDDLDEEPGLEPARDAAYQGPRLS